MKLFIQTVSQETRKKIVPLHRLQNYVILRKKDFDAKFIYVNTIEPGEEQYFIEETIAVLLLNTTFQNLF